MAAMAVLFKAFKEKQVPNLGTSTIFHQINGQNPVPVSVIVVLVLSINGSPMTFEGKDHIITLEGQKADVSRGLYLHLLRSNIWELTEVDFSEPTLRTRLKIPII